jgi:hypothetical protein
MEARAGAQRSRLANSVDVWEIRTPTDMRTAFADFARPQFLAVPDAHEPDVRAAWDEIFDDFALIEPAIDPPGLVAAYLDSIAEPLSRLRDLGMQLVEGHRLFVETGEAVQLFRSRESVELALEKAVPWCTTCAMAEIEGA